VTHTLQPNAFALMDNLVPRTREGRAFTGNAFEESDLFIKEVQD